MQLKRTHVGNKIKKKVFSFIYLHIFAFYNKKKFQYKCLRKGDRYRVRGNDVKERLTIVYLWTDVGADLVEECRLIAHFFL